MFRSLDNRPGHYVLLLVIAALLFLPNLGRPSLWDIDEGNNAEAAREMMESGNWIVPTFNYRLRVDKPALLYWLQIASYRLFGVSEFAARFPSALAAFLTVSLVYELARHLFSGATGLIAGIILSSTIGACGSAHFANPDALLHCSTVLALLIFWQSYAHARPGWFIPVGAVTGLAVLAKGPVGLVLPCAVVGFFLLWSRQLRLLWDRRLAWGALAFGLVALPWYVWVANDTKGEFLRGFLGTHNVSRFLTPMENHRGSIFYYPAVLAIGFAPWSAFLGVTGWYGTGRRARQDEKQVAGGAALPASYRFLWCWIIVYVVFFSAAATKLPNYVLPVYTPLAILTARFLERWRCGEIVPSVKAIGLSLSCLILIGLGTSAVLLIASGKVDWEQLHGKQLPGLGNWALLGAVPTFGAAAAWCCLRRQMRTGLIATLAITAVIFLGSVAACGSVALDAFKAPRFLAEMSRAQDTKHEIRVGCYQYFQPSLVFYCRRELQRLGNEEQVLEFLRTPLPVYLFVPASDWEKVEPKVRGGHRVAARHYDLYQGCEIMVVTN